MTPEERSRRARIAALTRWSREDPTANAVRAQRGLYDRFLREVDPNGELDPAERGRRADAAYRAHMHRLADRSAKSRRKGDAA